MKEILIDVTKEDWGRAIAAMQDIRKQGDENCPIAQAMLRRGLEKPRVGLGGVSYSIACYRLFRQVDRKGVEIIEAFDKNADMVIGQVKLLECQI